MIELWSFLIKCGFEALAAKQLSEFHGDALHLMNTDYFKFA